MRSDPLAMPAGKENLAPDHTTADTCIAHLVRSGVCAVCSPIKRIAGGIARPKQLWSRRVEACALYLDRTVEKLWIRDLGKHSNTYRHIAKLPMPALCLLLSSPLRGRMPPRLVDYNVTCQS